MWCTSPSMISYKLIWSTNPANICRPYGCILIQYKVLKNLLLSSGMHFCMFNNRIDSKSHDMAKGCNSDVQIDLIELLWKSRSNSKLIRFFSKKLKFCSKSILKSFLYVVTHAITLRTLLTHIVFIKSSFLPKPFLFKILNIIEL